MKFPIIAIFTLSLALMVGCSDSDGDDLSSVLKYDGDNANAPILPAFNYEAAARFPASLTSAYVDRTLSAIQFYLFDVPQNVVVVVYGRGVSAGTPGSVIYEGVATGLRSDAWNTHVLDTPLILSGEELWFSISFSHTSNTQSIGCDAGPANSNGDFLFSSEDNTWSTFRSRTGTESINWNIRGLLD